MKMDDWMIEQIEQEKVDAEVLKHVKNSTSDADFKHVEFELEESEHTSNYRIVYTPVGIAEYNKKYHYTIWINQSCGEIGDNYTGTVCMELSIRKYLMWDYWM